MDDFAQLVVSYASPLQDHGGSRRRFCDPALDRELDSDSDAEDGESVPSRRPAGVPLVDPEVLARVKQWAEKLNVQRPWEIRVREKLSQWFPNQLPWQDDVVRRMIQNETSGTPLGQWEIKGLDRPKKQELLEIYTEYGQTRLAVFNEEEVDRVFEPVGEALSPLTGGRGAAAAENPHSTRPLYSQYQDRLDRIKASYLLEDEGETRRETENLLAWCERLTVTSPIHGDEKENENENGGKTLFSRDLRRGVRVASDRVYHALSDHLRHVRGHGSVASKHEYVRNARLSNYLACATAAFLSEKGYLVPKTKAQREHLCDEGRRSYLRLAEYEHVPGRGFQRLKW